MKITQSIQKYGRPGSPGNWRWSPILAVLACLMAGSATAGTLTVTSAPISQPVNLSAEGDIDWAHWGSFTFADYDRKAGVVSQIPNFTPIGAGYGGSFGGAAANCSWVDGTVDKIMINRANGIYEGGVGYGYSMTIPASATPRVLNFYTSTYNSSGQLDLSLGDGSASPVQLTLAPNQTRRYTITFAGNAATTLEFSWQNVLPGTGGNITL